MKNFLLKNTPTSIKNLIKRNIDPYKYYSRFWADKYAEILAQAPEINRDSEIKVGIVVDAMMRHCYYEAACRELGVNYDLIEVDDTDWISKVKDENYPLIFIRPFVLTKYGKIHYDEVSYMLSSMMGQATFPSHPELWMYESKARCCYVLDNFNIPHPKTHVFHSKQKALAFLEQTNYPIVFKSDIGSDASGVEILQNKAQATSLVNQCFGRGYSNTFFDSREKQLGMILFQEFVPNAREIRVIRIGKSYFCYEKGKQGNFHSGSKIVLFLEVEPELLSFVEEVTDKANLDSVSVDVLVGDNKRYLVNEIQTYYGANEPGGYYYEDGREIVLDPGSTQEMRVDSQNGRCIKKDGEWIFEPGDFARNAGCNLRVACALQKLGHQLLPYEI